jgi:dUTP pyrophosphatase
MVNNEKEKIRGFEIVSDEHRKHDCEIKLPVRASKGSSGYDFFSNEDVLLLPDEKHWFWTDIKTYMLEDENLEIYVRSSSGIKKDLRLANTVGIIDSDYYENIKNDGNICICLKNTGKNNVQIEKYERIAQGIFKKFLKTDGDDSTDIRVGGIGSTN